MNLSLFDSLEHPNCCFPTGSAKLSENNSFSGVFQQFHHFQRRRARLSALKFLAQVSAQPIVQTRLNGGD
jgi:hypothetical protein